MNLMNWKRWGLGTLSEAVCQKVRGGRNVPDQPSPTSDEETEASQAVLHSLGLAVLSLASLPLDLGSDDLRLLVLCHFCDYVLESPRVQAFSGD